LQINLVPAVAFIDGHIELFLLAQNQDLDAVFRLAFRLYGEFAGRMFDFQQFFERVGFHTPTHRRPGPCPRKI
jgi:hypothetical protein